MDRYVTFFDNSVYTSLLTRFPHAGTPLEYWGPHSFKGISASFHRPTTSSPSFIAQNILHSMVFPVLGDAVATALVDTLCKSSRIIAAHHLGIDCFPEQVQSVHFVGMHKLLQPADDISVIPILACSGVPLQSMTFPRGLMLASQSRNGKNIHYPFFPSAMNDSLVYASRALQKNSIFHAMHQWKKSNATKLQLDSINRIVHDFLLHKDCLELDSFSKQIMYCNKKIFSALYPDNPNTHVVYLNLEEFARELLIHDIEEGNNAVSLLLFNRNVRGQVLKQLVNTRGCWKKEALTGMHLARTGSSGTVFFWAIDAKGRRIPLSIVDDGIHDAKLCNQDIVISLTPEGIVEALRAKRIYSSVFTSFMSVHLQHNIFCLGGIYMSQYLPTMINTVQEIVNKYALGARTEKDFESISPCMAYRRQHCSLVHPQQQILTPSDILCSGIMSVQCRCSDASLVPAGSIEIMAHGGLNREQLLEIAELKIADLLPLTCQEWTLQHDISSTTDAMVTQNRMHEQDTWAGLVLKHAL